ncbi:RmlC-like cupin domain-containing protein [Lipomyces oligophaga]|uniref:RmlC-like cupin domain-containing protein n=1 Tax=Lipomyces oligophaga TaxID=45792 RepID=UPI0034CD54E5
MATSPAIVSQMPTTIGRFDNLVDEIRRQLGFTSGIDSKDVRVEDLMEAMRRYTSSRSEWMQYALADPSRNYTSFRNGVDDMNEKANLLVLVWNPGKGSLIHDHANAHCIMKILQGELLETLYKQPSPSAPPQAMQQTKTSLYSENDVTYIADDIGLHKIMNPNPDKIAVSLHLYTPPWAAKYGCHSFDERTGKQFKVDLSNLYSDKGVLCPRPAHSV